jgi:pyrimidine deaminase RibD-like protein
MTPTAYQTLNNGVAYVLPAVPDPNPTITAGGAAIVANSVRQHSVDHKAYTLMRQKASRQQQ